MNGTLVRSINVVKIRDPDKFPGNYLFQLSPNEFNILRSKLSTAKFAKTRITPKAFTEKGLYMMAMSFWNMPTTMVL